MPPSANDSIFIDAQRALRYAEQRAISARQDEEIRSIARRIKDLLYEGRLGYAFLMSLQSMNEAYEAIESRVVNYLALAIPFPIDDNASARETLRSIISSHNEDREYGELLRDEIKNSIPRIGMYIHHSAILMLKLAVTDASVEIALQIAEEFLANFSEPNDTINLCVDITEMIAVVPKPGRFEAVETFLREHVFPRQAEQSKPPAAVQAAEKLGLRLIASAYRTESTKDAAVLRNKAFRIASLLVDQNYFDSSLTIARSMRMHALNAAVQNEPFLFPDEIQMLGIKLASMRTDESITTAYTMVREILDISPVAAVAISLHMIRNGIHVPDDITTAITGKITEQTTRLQVDLEDLRTGLLVDMQSSL